MAFDLTKLGLKTFKKQETENERNGDSNDSDSRPVSSSGAGHDGTSVSLDSEHRRVPESHEPGTEAGAGSGGAAAEDVGRGETETRHESVSTGSVDSRAGNDGPAPGSAPLDKVPVVGFLGRLNTGNVASGGPVIDGRSVESKPAAGADSQGKPGNFLSRFGNTAPGGKTAGQDHGNGNRGITLLDPQPEETGEEVIPPGPEGFQYKLDRLDSLIQATGQISPLTSDMVKKRIKDIFTELKEFPEYDGLIIDRDTHNIMAFMQHSITVARGVFEAKKEKKETKAKSPASRFKFDLDGPNSLETTMLHTPPSLASFGKMIADDIQAKNRGEK